MFRPLDGVKVLDLTHAMAGPYCTLMLADMGADVIKIEPLEGDESRRWIPPDINGESAYFLSVNRNKRGVAVNLKSDEGIEIIYKLAKNSDVLVENFRPGVMERLGLGYEKIREINPRIIYCSISGFGQSGPYRDKPGYDLIALAMSGLMSITGEPDGAPVKFGVPIADITTGMYAAYCVVNAIIRRERTGEGAHLDVSLLDVQVALLTHQAEAYFASGEDPKRLGSAHASIAPYQAFRARDGYIIIGVANERQWYKLCEVLGASHLLSDPKFSSNESRVKNRDELVSQMEQLLKRESVGSWIERLERAGVPVAPVKSVGEVLNDPHVNARGMIKRVMHRRAGEIRVLAFPVMIDGRREDIYSPPPTLGQHTDEVLTSLGYSEEEIEGLRRRGVII